MSALDAIETAVPRGEESPVSPAAKLVPTWVRIFTFVLALLNVGFGVLGYVRTSVLFPDLSSVPGLRADAPLLQHATHEFTARNLAIGLALLLVALVGVPESIAIVTLIRALIELQTVGLAVAQGSFGAGLVVPAVVFVAEVLVIRKMFALVAARDRAVVARGNPGRA